MTHDPTQLPNDLPIPRDDGACDHLARPPFDRLPPEVALPCTDGQTHRLRERMRGPSVVFFYPRTGVPGQPPVRAPGGEEWDRIPGARGCTPQCCGFRDLYAEFASLGVSIFGISTSTIEHQQEFRRRTNVPFDLLSDAELTLTRALHLPTFEFPVASGGPTTLLRRMAWYLHPHPDGELRIEKVWYPVFPPDACARMVLDWLNGRTRRRDELARAASERRTRLARLLCLRPLVESDRTLQRELFTRHFGGPMISSRGRWIDTITLPGFVVELDGRPAGLLVHTPPMRGQECELVAIAAAIEGVGAGSILLDACVNAARSAGASRVLLTTSNDNVDALRFYQLRGWRLARVYPGILEAARALKPHIPTHGPSGVPIRDDVELEIVFAPQGAHAHPS